MKTIHIWIYGWHLHINCRQSLYPQIDFTTYRYIMNKLAMYQNDWLLQIGQSILKCILPKPWDEVTKARQTLEFNCHEFAILSNYCSERNFPISSQVSVTPAVGRCQMFSEFLQNSAFEMDYHQYKFTINEIPSSPGIHESLRALVSDLQRISSELSSAPQKSRVDSERCLYCGMCWIGTWRNMC